MNFEPLTGELVVESLVTLDETTPTDVSVASCQGVIFLAWTSGDDHRINLMSSRDGYQFGGKQALGYTSTVLYSTDSGGGTRAAAPSLATSHHGLLLAWPYSVSRQRYPCVMWPRGEVSLVGQDKVHGTSLATPVAAWGDGAAVAWMCGQMLRVARSYGTTFDAPVDLGKTYTPISMCSAGNELVVAAVTGGFGGKVDFWWSHGGMFGQPITCSGVKGARVCALGSELAVAWRQKRGAFLGFLRNGTLQPALGLPIPHRRLSPIDPAICPHDGGLILAWQGQDRRINVVRVRRM